VASSSAAAARLPVTVGLRRGTVERGGGAVARCSGRVERCGGCGVQRREVRGRGHDGGFGETGIDDGPLAVGSHDGRPETLGHGTVERRRPCRRDVGEALGLHGGVDLGPAVGQLALGCGDPVVRGGDRAEPGSPPFDPDHHVRQRRAVLLADHRSRVGVRRYRCGRIALGVRECRAQGMSGVLDASGVVLDAGAVPRQTVRQHTAARVEVVADALEGPGHRVVLRQPTFVRGHGGDGGARGDETGIGLAAPPGHARLVLGADRLGEPREFGTCHRVLGRRIGQRAFGGGPVLGSGVDLLGRRVVVLWSGDLGVLDRAAHRARVTGLQRGTELAGQPRDASGTQFVLGREGSGGDGCCPDHRCGRLGLPLGGCGPCGQGAVEFPRDLDRPLGRLRVGRERGVPVQGVGDHSTLLRPSGERRDGLGEGVLRAVELVGGVRDGPLTGGGGPLDVEQVPDVRQRDGQPVVHDRGCGVGDTVAVAQRRPVGDGGGCTVLCGGGPVRDGDDDGSAVGEGEGIAVLLDRRGVRIECAPPVEESPTSVHRGEPRGDVLQVGDRLLGGALGSSTGVLTFRGGPSECRHDPGGGGLVGVVVPGGLAEPAERVTHPGVGGLDLGHRCSPSRCELVGRPVVDRGAEQGLQELPAVLARRAQEAGELALGQDDGLQELVAVQPDDAGDLDADLRGAVGHRLADHVRRVRESQELCRGLLADHAGPPLLGPVVRRRAADAVDPGARLEHQVDEGFHRGVRVLAVQPVGARVAAGQPAVQGVDDRVDDRRLARARRSLEQEHPGRGEGREVDRDEVRVGPDGAELQAVQVHQRAPCSASAAAAVSYASRRIAYSSSSGLPPVA
jgi:hypothetical protein